MVLPSRRSFIGRPLRRKTASIGWLSASTSASNREIAAARAIRTRCFRMRDAMPRPMVTTGHESDLCLARRGTVRCVAAATHQDFAVAGLVCDQQCHHAAEINVAELCELNLRQFLLWAEKAAIDRFPIEALEGLKKSAGVAGTDGAHSDHGAVLQRLACRVISRVHCPALSR